MNSPLITHRARLCTGFIAAVVTLLWLHPAYAHVKWFCSYDVAAAPRPIRMVATNELGTLVLVTL
ncbi:MAG TPA: hypothetical protein VLI93_06355, partial [Acetobacteraceae bacterium]|nr:hypothetical protein [Acetobacteraceae bacterium]